MKEVWDIYTKDREKTGREHVRGKPLSPGDYHVVVEVWTISNDGRILLTRRHPDKQYPLLWECTGGSAVKNETSEQGAQRELEEEIGLALNLETCSLVESCTSEDTIYDMWVHYTDVELEKLKLQDDEVIDAKLVTPAEFDTMYRNNEIIPKLKYFYAWIETGKITL